MFLKNRVFIEQPPMHFLREIPNPLLEEFGDHGLKIVGFGIFVRG